MTARIVLVLLLTALADVAAHGDAAPTIVVSSQAELEAAMVPENANRHILILNRLADPALLDYEVSERLTVPEGATVEGEGRMLYASDGLPSGFEPGTETRVGPASNFLQVVGGRPEIFSMGDRSILRGLTVVSPKPGNGVGIMSSASGPVTASVSECDIFAPGFTGPGSNFGPQGGDGFLPAGPLGRGVLVRSRHPGSRVTAHIERSIVHGEGSNAAVLVINSTSGAHLTAFLTQNVLKDGLRQLDIVGGSGGDGTRDALGNFVHAGDGNSSVVHSRGNLYAGRGNSADIGVIVEGGYDGRGFAPQVRPGASFNQAAFDSVDDRIEQVGTGIYANASLRSDMNAGPCSFNDVDVRLLGTVIRTVGLGRDVAFEVTRSTSSISEPAGDGNTIRVLARSVDASGAPNNLYAVATGTLPVGMGNALVFVGSAEAFERANDGILPPPPPELFLGDAPD